MQLVIDIPKDRYNEICNGTFDTDGYFKMNLSNAFINGTPLPKGHGRLVDIGKYEKECFNVAIQYDDGNHIHSVYTSTIPSIIEADRAESE